MYTYVDSLMVGGLEPGTSLVMIHNLDDNTISVVEAGGDDLAYLGADNVDRYPFRTPVEVADSEGERHVIIILAKASE